MREEVADVAREDRGLRDGADDVADIGRRKDVGAAEERVVGVRANKSKLSDLKKNLFGPLFSASRQKIPLSFFRSCFSLISPSFKDAECSTSSPNPPRNDDRTFSTQTARLNRTFASDRLFLTIEQPRKQKHNDFESQAQVLFNPFGITPVKTTLQM